MSHIKNTLVAEAKCEAMTESLYKALKLDLPIFLKAQVIKEVMGLDTKILIQELNKLI